MKLQTKVNVITIKTGELTTRHVIMCAYCIKQYKHLTLLMLFNVSVCRSSWQPDILTESLTENNILSHHQHTTCILICPICSRLIQLVSSDIFHSNLHILGDPTVVLYSATSRGISGDGRGIKLTPSLVNSYSQSELAWGVSTAGHCVGIQRPAMFHFLPSPQSSI